MTNCYTEFLTLRSCNCDLCGSWMPSAILEIMQETAGAHSALLGLDRKTMTDMNLAWVLSRVKVQMNRLPCVNERLKITTFPTPQKHLFYPRVHVFEDGRGAVVGEANSLWVLMDIKERKITKSDAVSQLLPSNKELASQIVLPATVRALDGVKQTATLFPQFTDFDVNQHVNNTKYLNWCCNAIGLETMKAKWISSFDINYNAEILAGDEVHTELVLTDDCFSFRGCRETTLSFCISGRLSLR